MQKNEMKKKLKLQAEDRSAAVSLAAIRRIRGFVELVRGIQFREIAIFWNLGSVGKCGDCLTDYAAVDQQ
jgi:hypothetical protein